MRRAPVISAHSTINRSRAPMPVITRRISAIGKARGNGRV